MINLGHTDAKKLANMITEVFALGDKYGTNFLHNYAYREHFAIMQLKKIIIDIESDNKICGKDFTSKDYKNGELKSCTCKRLKSGHWSKSKIKFEFDKQTDPIRRKQTKQYDCLVFSAFDRSNIVFQAVIRKSPAIRCFKRLVNTKQKEFIKKQRAKKALGQKMNRDSIAFTYADLKDMEGVEYFINGKTVRFSTIKALFGDKT